MTGPPRLHVDELGIDAGLVRRLLAEQFPAWAGLPLALVESSGTDNVIYRLGDELAVRLPRRPSAGSQLDLEREWLPRLAPRLPVAIPRVVAEGRPAAGYPSRWAVHRWLAGETAPSGGLGELPAAAADLATFVAALWRVDPAGAPPSRRGGPLATLDAGVRRAIGEARGDVDADAVTAAWAESLRAPEWNRPPVWTHGDLFPGNVLVRDGRLAAVIDFGVAGLGDPACDLFSAWCLFSGGARDAYRAALGVDDATWERGRGWALALGLAALPYYRETNPVFAAVARDMLDRVLAG